MIIISPNVVLADDSQGINENNPVFGYHNLVTEDNVSATSFVAGYPASNVGNTNTVLGWRASSLVTQHLTVDLTSYSDEVDYIAVAKHNFGTGQVLLAVEAATGVTSGQPSGWVSVSSTYLVADDSPLIIRFAPRLATGVRLVMTPASVAPTANVLYVGKLLIGQRRIYVGHTPITDGRVTRFVTGVSESAHFLGRIQLGRLNQTSVEMLHLTPSWVRQYLRPFVRATEVAPFFFAWRPGSYPNEVGFVWHTSDVRISNAMSNGMMQFNMDIAGLA